VRLWPGDWLVSIRQRFLCYPKESPTLRFSLIASCKRKDNHCGASASFTTSNATYPGEMSSNSVLATPRESFAVRCVSRIGRKTGCLITGQNPASSTSAAKALLKVLKAEAMPA